MLFKNFVVYTLNNESLSEALNVLNHETLSQTALKPRHKTQRISSGWVPPLKSVSDNLVLEIDGARFVKLGIETALISENAVNKEAQERIGAAIKAGKELDKGEQRQVTDAVRDEHLANAKTEISYMLAYLDTKTGRLIVAGGKGNGQEITATLRDALGSFPCTPLKTEKLPSNTLQTYLINESCPTYTEDSLTYPLFTFGSYYKFVSAESAKKTITVNDTLDPEFASSLNNCRSLAEVALQFKERATFKMTDTFAFKALKFTDQCHEEFEENMGDTSTDDPAITNMFLEVNEIRQLLNDLITLFGGIPKPVIKADEKESEFS